MSRFLRSLDFERGLLERPGRTEGSANPSAGGRKKGL